MRNIKPCPKCGGPMKDTRSKQCKSCYNKVNRGNWKGGTWINNGYVMMYMPSHPNSQANGYIREHTVVMSEYLGRPLLPNENVHHKNGVRNDNRIKNLELWTKKQPSGQRAEDLYRYAKEIISLYGPIFETGPHEVV